MKKFLGFTFGGFQRKTLILVLLVLAMTSVLFLGIMTYQNRQLIRIVEEAKSQQQGAISAASSETMQQVIGGSLTQMTNLQADLADNDFQEVIHDIYTLQSMAQGLIENRTSVDPMTVSLPDASMEGTSSAFVLCEEGVDYTKSRWLGVLAHMSSAMIAMHSYSEKIDGCYIGLADGTDLCVDEKAGQKLDGSGKPIPFPVRERPWYTGAVQEDGLYFTDIVEDAFSGKMLVTCSVPIYIDDEIIGVIGIDVTLESVDDFVNTGMDGWYAYIVNDHGRIILGPESGGIFAGEIAEQSDIRLSSNQDLVDLVTLSRKENTGLQTILIDGKEYYAVGAPMNAIGWSIINIVDKEMTERPEHQMLSMYDGINEEASDRFVSGFDKITKIGLVLLIVVLILSLLAAYYVTKRMARPIVSMTQDIRNSHVSGDIFEMKDAYRTDDEIELLAESFADLSKKTKQYVEEVTRATAEKERISTELELATSIQLGMIPHVFPPFPERKEIELYASMDPAKEVGGDFYDFFLIDDDHLGLVMADVSGKGVPASLFMMASKIILQSVAMLGGSPAEILTKTNDAICSNNQAGMFVTVWVGILEISTGRLTCANAGHEYPILKEPDGAFALYKDRHGFVLGGMEGMKYSEYELQLRPGTSIFLYTDGVTEAANEQNELFGTDRMLAALNMQPEAAPNEILRNVRAQMDAFVGKAEQFDDITMLCIEYKGKEHTV